MVCKNLYNIGLKKLMNWTASSLSWFSHNILQSEDVIFLFIVLAISNILQNIYSGFEEFHYCF